jgi:hypothetical protein
MSHVQGSGAIAWTPLLRKTPLTPEELVAAFADPFWAKRFPPILSVSQTSEIVGVPEATVYDSASRGRLKDCSFRVGRYRRFWRDHLILHFFNQG